VQLNLLNQEILVLMDLEIQVVKVLQPYPGGSAAGGGGAGAAGTDSLSLD
jgi:hypothetical protein